MDPHLFKPLSPFINANGVLLVITHRGSLPELYVKLQYCKHPILIAKQSHFVLLLGGWYYIATCYANPCVKTIDIIDSIMSMVKTTFISHHFWLVSLRSVLHCVNFKCSICRCKTRYYSHLSISDSPITCVQQQ